jgi:UDP-N-acetyl-D-mannosaminuronic acid dehydrogenase
MLDLVHRLESRTSAIGVVGLGPTGLAAAVAFAAAGFRVVGVDRDRERAEYPRRAHAATLSAEPELASLLDQALSGQRLATTGRYEPLREVDAVLVTVETPVGKDRRPVTEPLLSACREAGRTLAEGALLVIESTVAPGTMARVVAPALAAASAGRRFLLGHCPERVMHGRLLENVRALPRVCGAQDPDAARAMLSLYRTVTTGRLTATDLVTAELVKTAENAYRDVNLAFANELALACEAAGGDFRAVRALVNECPERHVLWAGTGVGGACIPKDPWLLASALGPGGARLLPAARAVNDGMPEHVAGLVVSALAERGKGPAGARVAILGWSYLAGSSDTRNSPSAALLRALEARGFEIVVHDPFVGEHAGDLWERVRGAHAAVIATAHEAYRDLDLRRLAEALALPVLVDGRHVVDPDAARTCGFTFRGLGRGARRSP